MSLLVQLLGKAPGDQCIHIQIYPFALVDILAPESAGRSMYSHTIYPFAFVDILALSVLTRQTQSNP